MVNRSILDAFSAIKNEEDAKKPDFCIKVLKHLAVSKITNTRDETDEHATPANNDQITRDIEASYVCGRLVQGLGSNNVTIRKCYFATLVTLLSNKDSLMQSTGGSISMGEFVDIVDRKLSSFDSKREEGEVLGGRILAYGAAIHSELYFDSPIELQREILSEIITKANERSYLPLMAYTFILDLANSKRTDKNMFETVIWPIIKERILLPWDKQTFEGFYLLIELRAKYANAIRGDLKKIHGTKEILNVSTLDRIVKFLVNIQSSDRLNHPVYASVCGYICEEEREDTLLLPFWKHIDIFLSKSPTRIQRVAATVLFENLVKRASFKNLPALISKSMVEILVMPSDGKKGEIVSKHSKSAVDALLKRVMENEQKESKLIYKVLKRLVLHPQTLLIDKRLGVKIMTPLISKLDKKQVKLVAAKCESIINLQNDDSSENSKMPRWSSKQRIYAAQILPRLVHHSNLQGESELDWKMEKMKFLVEKGYFQKSQCKINNDLSSALRTSLFGILKKHSFNVASLKKVYVALIEHIDCLMNNKVYSLREPLSPEISGIWQSTVKIIRLFENSEKCFREDKRPLSLIFTLMLLQMALHILTEPNLSCDSIKDLVACFKNIDIFVSQTKRQKFHANLDAILKSNSSSRIDDSKNCELHWTEVMVDLMLSLLSRESRILRELILRTFPFLTSVLTPSATAQILQVLNPEAGEEILSTEGEKSGESSEEDGESSDEDGESADKDGESSDEDKECSGMDGDDMVQSDDDMDESSLDKMKQAVREVLCATGNVTDSESIDLDEMSESEGKTLDANLSQVFKMHVKMKPKIAKKKKQTQNERTLTHFKIRILDMVDIYLEHKPEFNFVLDAIETLIRLLEHTMKDPFQMPLEEKIKSTFRKIKNLKNVSAEEKINPDQFESILKSCIYKGERTNLTFGSVSSQLAAGALFMVKSVARQPSWIEPRERANKLVVSALNEFFAGPKETKSVLPSSFFEELLSCYTHAATDFGQTVLNYTFDRENVSLFKRVKGLNILLIMFGNYQRCKKTLSPSEVELMVDFGKQIVKRGYEEIRSLKQNGDRNATRLQLSTSFNTELLNLLFVIKRAFANDDIAVEWELVKKVLPLPQVFGKMNKPMTAFYRKLCSALNVKYTLLKSKNSENPQTPDGNAKKEENSSKKILNQANNNNVVTRKEKKRKITEDNRMECDELSNSTGFEVSKAIPKKRKKIRNSEIENHEPAAKRSKIY